MLKVRGFEVMNYGERVVMYRGTILVKSIVSCSFDL